MSKSSAAIVLAFATIVLGAAMYLSYSAVQVAYKLSEPPVGASPGQDFTQERSCFNGICHNSFSMRMRTATTTPCAFKINATSTMVFSSASVTTGTSSTGLFTLAKSTSFNATTTRIQGLFSLASGAAGSIVSYASSTGALVDPATVLSPGDYLVWGVAGASAAGHTYTGFCKAETIELNN